MPDEQVDPRQETEREKLFGAFRRLNAILRRSPSLEELEITTPEDLKRLRDYWRECWQPMQEILRGK